jgi:putative ABC transport system ATP-binding protein
MALTFMLTRQKVIILIINLLIMNSLLKLKNVNLKYQTGNNIIKVLKNINLETKKNESISIVGESGSGKTSLIMLVGGLEKATSGKIFFEDQEISKMSEDEVSRIRRKNIGIVFQSFYLIPNYTAVENVALTLELNNLKNPYDRAKELLDRFGLKNRFNNLPSQLSGGEQQRVAIARAIAMKPKLILADEPTGNLDSENSQMIADILFKYIKEEKSSLIMVTHDPKLANKAKRKIKIKDGKIV